MNVLNLLIPVFSLITGILLLITSKLNKNIVFSIKTYIIKLEHKKFLLISPVIFAITLLCKGYFMYLSMNTTILNISLFVIQLMILINFTLLSDFSVNSDF